MSRNKFIVTALAPQLITGICLYLYFNENIIDWVRAFFLMWAALNFGGGFRRFLYFNNSTKIP